MTFWSLTPLLSGDSVSCYFVFIKYITLMLTKVCDYTSLTYVFVWLAQNLILHSKLAKNMYKWYLLTFIRHILDFLRTLNRLMTECRTTDSLSIRRVESFLRMLAYPFTLEDTKRSTWWLSQSSFSPQSAFTLTVLLWWSHWRSKS